MKGITILILVLLVKFSHGQYINIDSLVVVPGEPLPLSIVAIEKKGMNISGPEYNPNLTTGMMLSKFGFPVQNKIISRFGPRRGRMHNGTDIRSATGDTIIAAFGGKIIRSKYYYGFGNLIVIQHDKNIKTYYAHLSKYLKKSGNWVKKGDAIGLAGSTGRATGSHLHFEIRENDKAYDPELIFDFKTGETRADVESVKNLVQLQRKLIPKGYSVNEGVPQYYTVRSGDSLWRISRRFKMSINHICKLNKISENSILRLGQPLKLY
jgi:hypothetical protein